MPSAPPEPGLTETWFCPGVPATGVDGVEGSIVIANRSAERRVGTILVYNEQAQNRRLELAVDAYSMATVDLDATLPGAMVGAVVEVEGGGALVEQQAFHPSGNSSAACANATSDTWYLADGFTVDGSVESLILSNPYDDVAIAQLTFATETGESSPSAFRGFPIPAFGDPARSRARRPGRAGHRRRGHHDDRPDVLAARTTWAGDDSAIRLPRPGAAGSVLVRRRRAGRRHHRGLRHLQPTDADVDVDAVPSACRSKRTRRDPDDHRSVALRSCSTRPTSNTPAVPDGRHAVVFSTLAEPSIAVERSHPTADDSAATSVVLGAPLREDGFVATQWHLGPADPTTAAPGLQRRQRRWDCHREAVGPGGLTAIEG
jgi:hypothetical protein